jgi:hypothetical protein
VFWAKSLEVALPECGLSACSLGFVWLSCCYEEPNSEKRGDGEESSLRPGKRGRAGLLPLRLLSGSPNSIAAQFAKSDTHPSGVAHLHEARRTLHCDSGSVFAVQDQAEGPR